MSNWSQHQPEMSNDYGVNNECNDSQNRVLSQPYPTPTKLMTTSSTIDFDVNSTAYEQYQATNVTVNLFDCMRCYVLITRREVEPYIYSCDKSTPTDSIYRETPHVQASEQDLLLNKTVEIHTNHELNGLQQEQENRSDDDEPNMTVPPPTPEEEDIYMGSFWDSIHDYGFMETYIIID